MSIEQEQERIMKKLSSYLPRDLLPAYSLPQLNREKEITRRENDLLAQIKQRKETDFTGLSYGNIREGFKTAKTPRQNEGLNNQEVEALAFLINKFEDTYKMTPYDEQIVALIRTVEAYKSPNKKKIFELMTSEGKSSVTIPIVLSYLGLKEDSIQIHLVSPYLVKRDFERFCQFAKNLGIEDEVAQLETPNDSGKLKKRFVFGLWSDFVHAYQNNFIESKSDFPQDPVIVMDEIDQICYDEMVTPAVISSQVKTEPFIDKLFTELKKDAEKTKPEKFLLPTGETVEIDPKEYYPRNREEFEQHVKFLLKDMLGFIKANKDKIKSSDPRDIHRFLSENDNFSFYMFCKVANEKSAKGLDWSEKKQEKTFKELKRIHGQRNFSFWWDDSEFQEALISAFTLRKGEDYEVTDSVSHNAVMQIILLRKPISPFVRKVTIKTTSTGYLEKNKEYDTLTNYLLYLKEGVEIPKEINGPSTDTLQTSNFYQSFNKIFGFTGTVSTIAKRLNEVYGMETQLIPNHFLTQRETKTKLTNNFDEKITIINEEITSRQQNSIIVVESTQQAEKLKAGIKKENLETKTLSALNEDQDSDLFSWISKKGDKQRVLICVKMIGRGVDLQPDEELKKEGLFLIATTPFEYERSYLQLIGRVGRRGEKGEILTLISPDNNVFSRLSADELKDLKNKFRNNKLKAAEKYLNTAWNRWEDSITEEEKTRKKYYKPILFLRGWVEGNKKLDKNIGQPENKKMVDWFKKDWGNWLWYFEETFKVWMAARPLGPFGQGNEETIWTNYVLDEVKKIYKQEI